MEFHSYLNDSHHTIKFDDPQHDPNTNSCNYLDINIKIEEGHIVTDVYRKPTSGPSALLPSSAHPGHTTPGNIFSMAFRLLRIVSSPELLQIRLQELKNDYLVPRDYNPKMINDVFTRVNNITREEALQKVDKSLHVNKNKKRIVVPLDYNPRLPNQNMVLRKHHKAMTVKNTSLKEVFPELPWQLYARAPI